MKTKISDKLYIIIAWALILTFLYFFWSAVIGWIL